MTASFDGRLTEVDELLAEIEALVHRRDELHRRDAGEDELAAVRHELERLRWLLARAVREAAYREGPRAA